MVVRKHPWGKKHARSRCMAVAFAAAACWASPSPASGSGAPAQVSAIDPPAPPGSTYPTLAAEGATTVTEEHEVLMTWLEPAEPAGRLRFARLSGQSWSPPITVAEQVSAPAPGDRPSLTVIDTQGVRRTLVARTGDVIARSGDGGRAWVRLPAPTLPSASFAGGEEGGWAFWLDAAEDGSAKLLGSRILAGETLLDAQVAGGPGTSAAMTWDGPVVVYRDAGAEGAREVALVRRRDARWNEPRPVHGEGWRPAGGSASSPRVAALRRRVAVAWTTETPTRSRVVVAFSDDAGGTFGDPVEVDGAEGADVPSGRVDVVLDDNGDALVLWTVTSGSAATLRLARASAGGGRGEELVLAQGLPADPAAFPGIARAGGRVAVTWIEDTPSRVRAVTIALTAVPAPVSPAAAPAVAAKKSRRYSGRGRVGDGLPDFELVSLAGDPVSVESLNGRAILLNLWATWCLPCLAEMPELAALRERYRPQGLVVLAVNVDSAGTSDKVRAFVAEREMPFEVWLDPEMRLYEALRVRGLPASFVVDREGRIVLRRDEAITAGDRELAEALRRALGGS